LYADIFSTIVRPTLRFAIVFTFRFSFVGMMGI